MNVPVAPISPYAQNIPILVGLLVDVSGSMTSAIQNRGTTQNRLESFRDALEGFVSEYANAIEKQSKDHSGRVKLFAYGFGFGNPLAGFLGRSGPKVRDLLALPNAPDSTIDIVLLAKDWPRYKAHVEGLAVEMFGSTPMGEAFRTATKRFSTESSHLKAQQILFVLSDGEPSDSSPQEIATTADEMKASGTLIISCYVTSEDVAEPRHIYGAVPSHWSQGARLMFDCASPLAKDSPFDTYLREYGWKIDEGGRLFTQINQSELLAEFMNVVLSPLKNDLPAKNLPDKIHSPANPSVALAPQPIAEGQVRSPEPAARLPEPQPVAQPNWPAWIFGGLLVLFFMGVIWFKPATPFNPPQAKLLRILASILVGVISAFFTGNLRLEGKVPGLKDVQIGTIGGFAGFALTFFLW